MDRYYKIYDTSALAHSKIHFMRFPTHLLAWLEAIMLPSNVYHSTVPCGARTALTQQPLQPL